MKLPLANYRAASDPVMLGPEGEISAGAFFARVHELAVALPDAPFVINLSESRIAFMLGFAAALVRGQTSLLPSGQGRDDWEQLAQHYPGASIIRDRPIDSAHAFDLTPYLTMGALPQSALPQSALPHSALTIPEIDADFAAAILFTSGSTGRPTAHAKSWGQLSRGAAHLMAALGWTLPARHAVVGSVPPQHMFGLETTVMLPWHAGIPVHVHRPLLPADLETAVSECARPCWWMTTPVHLRPPLLAMTATAMPLTLAGIVASTMSLPPALAAAAEARWQIPVLEIYGSTETGALATRRTAADEWWTPLPGVELLQQDGGKGEEWEEEAAGAGKDDGDGEVRRILASGSHIYPPVLLADQLHFNPDGRFLWLGRSTDLLKIGGKRASLSALNQRITEIAGVDDGAYFVPDAAGGAASHDDAHPARRLAAFYVSASLSPEQVRMALRACVDPVFVPRPLIRVDGLPRNPSGKLPHAVLAEMFSQWKQADGGGSPAQRIREVPVSHPALPGHFPGNPIVPGVVILSQVTDAIRCQLPHFVPGTLLAMRFHYPLRPGRPFWVRTELRGELVHFEVHEGDAHGVSAKLIAAGQWASGVETRADERA